MLSASENLVATLAENLVATLAGDDDVELVNGPAATKEISIWRRF